MTEREEFLRICEVCKRDAYASGHKRFVRRRLDWFTVSGDGGNGWLFYAYPGGRTVLSTEGAELAGVSK